MTSEPDPSAPAGNEPAKARARLAQWAEEERCRLRRAETVEEHRHLDPAFGRGNQGVAHAPPGLVIVPDIIKDSQRFPCAVDQGDKRLEPLRAVREQGQPVFAHVDRCDASIPVAHGN